MFKHGPSNTIVLIMYQTFTTKNASCTTSNILDGTTFRHKQDAKSRQWKRGIRFVPSSEIVTTMFLHTKNDCFL